MDNYFSIYFIDVNATVVWLCLWICIEYYCTYMQKKMRVGHLAALENFRLIPCVSAFNSARPFGTFAEPGFLIEPAGFPGVLKGVLSPTKPRPKPPPKPPRIDSL